MKKFKFRLDRVIKLHNSSKYELEADLVDIHSDLGTIGAQIISIRKEIRTYQITGGLHLVENYRHHLRKQVSILEKKETELSELAAQVMALIADVSSKEKSLDRLKEKRQQAHEKEALKKERRMIDD